MMSSQYPNDVRGTDFDCTEDIASDYRFGHRSLLLFLLRNKRFCHKRRKVVGFARALPYNNIFAAESVTLKFLSIYFPILASWNPVPYFTSLLF